MTYVKSKDIQLFPSAFRGQYETTGTVFNPGSRLTTEYNLTTLSSRTSKYHQSYVLDYKSETADRTIIFNIKGYLFSIKMNSYLASFTSQVWARIRLVDIDSDDTNNTKETKPVLRPVDTAASTIYLDEVSASDGNFYFLGIDLSEEEPDEVLGQYVLLILEKVNGDWSVPSKSYFRLRADEISDKTSTNKSIDEEFNTITLNATDLRGIKNISANYFADESLNISAESIVLNLDYGFESSDKNFNFAGNIVTTESLQVSNDTNKSGADIYGPTTIYNGETPNFTLTPGTSIVTTLPITISSTATSTSPITGALKVKGGVGIEENLNVAQLLSVGLVGSGSVAGTSSMKLFNRSLSATATTLQPGVGTTNITLTLPIVAGTLARIEDINALDVTGTSSFGAGKTIKSWSETDGLVSITSQDIEIVSSQISDKTNSYNSSGEDVVTGKAVAAALATLDVAGTSNTAGKTISAWSEVDGKVSISTQDISITSSQISDKTDLYSGTGTVAITGTGVKAALDTLNVSGTSSFGAGNTISAWSETYGKVSITSQPISITKSQVSDFAHTHSYAASSSEGGSATTVTTTADTSNTLSLVGVTSGATTTLKRTTFITMNGGNLYATTFNASSDRRLKENIVDYKYHDSILDIAVKEFDYKNTNVHTIGFVAQELQEKFPEIVTSGEDGYLSIAENKLVYLLLEEVKQLKEEVEQLKRGG